MTHDQIRNHDPHWPIETQVPSNKPVGPKDPPPPTVVEQEPTKVATSRGKTSRAGEKRAPGKSQPPSGRPPGLRT